MELRNLLSVLKRWAWLLILAPVLVAAVAYFVSLQMQPLYRASATLLVSQAGGSSLLDYSSLLTSERVASTYAELLTKRPLLEQVISNLQLDITSGELEEKTNVLQFRDTQLLELQVEDSDPQLAVAIANGLASAFVEKGRRERTGDLSGYEQMLAEQIAEMEREIRELEARLEQQGKEEEVGALLEEGDVPSASDLRETLRQARLTYATLLEGYLQIRAIGGRSIYVEVVEPAALPARKVQPRIVFNTLIAGVAGLILTLGFVFLLQYLDDSLTRPENAEQALGIPTLATIPSMQMRSADNHEVHSIIRPASPFAEAHRTLRTNIQFSSLDKVVDSLLVTSAHAQEGKTTVVANLGVVMAQAGLKVLLVDADLRRGTLHEVFDMPNENGLTQCLLEETFPGESDIRETNIPGLYLLPSGPPPPTPSELLISERMKELTNHLRDLADVVLFDSPPILAVTDAAVLATRVDGTLLVVQSGQTPKEDARKALRSLQSVGARVLGTVLTRCHSGNGGYYYGRADADQSLLRRVLSSESFPGRVFISSLMTKRRDKSA
jgi:capsular exopolysaccharide synthesis family protein